MCCREQPTDANPAIITVIRLTIEWPSDKVVAVRNTNNMRHKAISDEALSHTVREHGEWLKYDLGARACLENMDLRGRNFRDADLEGATFRDSNLQGADFTDANLLNADFTRADLTGACLWNATIDGIVFDNTRLPSPVLDLSGCATGYKVVMLDAVDIPVVIELKFPEGTKFASTITSRKCRASEAVVVRCITPKYEDTTTWSSIFCHEFSYRLGQSVVPVKPLDANILTECAAGIHFFVTREEAERYSALLTGCPIIP